jgi:hypothetical protein
LGWKNHSWLVKRKFRVSKKSFAIAYAMENKKEPASAYYKGRAADGQNNIGSGICQTI